MEQFKAVAKKWGNSIGITIPAEVVERAHIKSDKKMTVLILNEDQKEKIKKSFGSLKPKRKTQEIMDDIDEGYDEH